MLTKEQIKKIESNKNLFQFIVKLLNEFDKNGKVIRRKTATIE